MEKVLLSVIGPTGIGKTKLAIALAKHFKTEIISADSRQFYQEMSIGTAVPSPSELREVPHHFIQHRSIYQEYSVGDYEREAISLLDRLFEKYTILVLVGGSGLYVDAVIKGLDSFPKVDGEIRATLNEMFRSHGIEELQRQLKKLDPDYFAQVDPDNPHRLIRALEVCIASGRPYSSFLNGSKPKRSFKNLTVGIEADREIIYDRINKRVDLMMDQGLLKEARELYAHRHLNALQTVGYKELFNYFDGTYDLDFAISEIKKNTRRFAKRQLTWYRKTPAVLWTGYEYDEDALFTQISKRLNSLADE